MYVGHYVAAFALKKQAPTLSLGWLFIGVQFVDILFFPFVLMGVERLNLIPDYTATNHFELEYMPYTHSLLATVVWSIFGFLVFRYLFKLSVKAAFAMALAIASHWFVDLLVHTPDLPIWSDKSPKLGFGLWNYRYVAFGLETLFLFGGIYLYQKAINSKSISMYIFGLVLITIHATQVFLPPPEVLNKTTLAISAVASYLLFAWIAHKLDKRNQKTFK